MVSFLLHAVCGMDGAVDVLGDKAKGVIVIAIACSVHFSIIEGMMTSNHLTKMTFTPTHPYPHQYQLTSDLHADMTDAMERMNEMTETTEWMRAPVPNRSSAVKGANRPHPTSKRHCRFTRINEHDKDHEPGGFRTGQATPYMHVEGCDDRDEDGRLQRLRSEMMRDDEG